MKKQDWASSLNETIESYYSSEFIWGENDCLIFIADCVESMTGYDFMEEWRGQYSNEDEASSLMLKHWDGLINKGWDDISIPIDTHKAQRGDFGTLYFMGKKNCGVVDMSARFLLVRTEHGIHPVKLKDVDRLRLWRILD